MCKKRVARERAGKAEQKENRFQLKASGRGIPFLPKSARHSSIDMFIVIGPFPFVLLPSAGITLSFRRVIVDPRRFN